MRSLLIAGVALLVAAQTAVAQAPAAPARALDPAAERNLAPAKNYKPPEGISFRADDSSARTCG